MRHSLCLSLYAALAWSGIAGAQSPKVKSDEVVAPQRVIDPALQHVISGSWREPGNVARDRFRHPAQTLTFFGLRPSDTVIEITPGNGWYSEILAPYLAQRGHYIAAVVDPASAPVASQNYQAKARQSLEKLFASAPQQYGKATMVSFAADAPVLGSKNSADVVLTFRNVHNWLMVDGAEKMFESFFEVLKPGGTLGVVEHRANAEVSAGDKRGYVSEKQVQALAEAAGFKLLSSSEINANPRDTKDYPGGVWTLPPANRHAPEDDAKYQQIGESDRMTLRFIKPAS